MTPTSLTMQWSRQRPRSNRGFRSQDSRRRHTVHAPCFEQALQWYGRQPSPTLTGFVDMLDDPPDDLSGLADAREIAADLSQNLRASMANDPLFGGKGTAVDPAVLLTPSEGYRARVSVISMTGLSSDEQRQGFVNELQMTMFVWIKRNPAGDRPLGGLMVMDEAQNFVPQRSYTNHIGVVVAGAQVRAGARFRDPSAEVIGHQIPGNAATQFDGLLNAPAQIDAAKEMACAKGGLVADISSLRASNFYVATEGQAFHRTVAQWCLIDHPPSPLSLRKCSLSHARNVEPNPRAVKATACNRCGAGQFTR